MFALASIYPAKVPARASDPDDDAVSLTRVCGLSAQGSTVALAGTIIFRSIPGRSYTIQRSSELTTWGDLGAVIAEPDVWRGFSRCLRMVLQNRAPLLGR